MGIKQLTHLYLKASQDGTARHVHTARNVLVSRGLKYRAWPIFQHVSKGANILRLLQALSICLVNYKEQED